MRVGAPTSRLLVEAMENAASTGTASHVAARKR